MSSPATQPPAATPPTRETTVGHSADTSSPGTCRTALYHWPAHLRLWAILLVGLGVDLWSKEWAFHTLRQGGHRELIPNVLEFHTTLNPGALFGLGAGKTEVFLIASVLALILVVWMFAHSPAHRWATHLALGAILAGALGNMYDRAFVGLVAAVHDAPGGRVLRHYVRDDNPGGDTVLLREYPPTVDQVPRTVTRSAADALGRPVGYVRDFIKIPTRWLGGRDLWPWVFNVADVLLVVGVAVLALRLLGERKAHTVPDKPELDVPPGEP